MRELYSAVVEPGSDGYRVSFPTFPACIAFGRTPKEALSNASEALTSHIQGIFESGEDIPFEGDPEDEFGLHASGGVDGNKFPTFIEVRIPEGSERVNVYLPRRLISMVDDFASNSGMNRSSVFGLAVRRLLMRERSMRLSGDPFVDGPKLRAVADQLYGGSLDGVAEDLLEPGDLNRHFDAVHSISTQDRPRYLSALQEAFKDGSNPGL